MVFNLKGKVALITGGASGIGLAIAKELLRNEAKGVTLADVDSNLGETELKEIEKEFGPDKAIFVKTDVSNIQQFEDAFKKTVETFKNVDILVNNAGISNDGIWEKEIAVNVNGAVHGILLGLENYLLKYREGTEAVIVNTSSVAGISVIGSVPTYAGTKAAIIAMTRSWSDPVHYERSKVRIIAICPGATATPLALNVSGRNLGEPYEKWMQNYSAGWSLQEPKYVAQEVAKLIQNSENGTIWVIEGSEPAYEYVLPERETLKAI